MMCANILSITEVAQERIFSFLSYEEISKCRIVCQKFNQVGSQLLTRGFAQVEKRHGALYRKMRGQLPRRESERRSHPVARHCDILSAVETRMSMLAMTYCKYIDKKVCCFIPGKVLDELITILNKVENTQHPPRTHELLQELRDISSMAMEHFDENILPGLQTKVEESNSLNPSASGSKVSANIALIKKVFSCEMQLLKKEAKQQKTQILILFKSLKCLDSKYKNQTKLLRKSTLKIREQERILEEHATKIKDQETTITELKRHVEEWDQKLSDLTSELIRAREELLSGSKPPNTSPLIYPGTNIKPRISLRYCDPPAVCDVDRKRKSPFAHTETPSKMSKCLDNTNITNVIDKTLTDNISNMAHNKSTEKSHEIAINKSIDFCRSGFGGFLSNSLEKLIKNPITNIKSRKRKMSGELNFT